MPGYKVSKHELEDTVHSARPMVLGGRQDPSASFETRDGGSRTRLSVAELPEETQLQTHVVR